jgi:hypothetical protein
MRTYKVLRKNHFDHGSHSLVPIRHEDRFRIMDWRNEQMYHLRQTRVLTKEQQDEYFNSVIPSLFDLEKPGQLLFSFLENGICIGYGGLVHINWTDLNAEISFLFQTNRQELDFDILWRAFLVQIEEVAFKQLKLEKIYTYAFDVRPNLYNTLICSGYSEDARLSRHVNVRNVLIDVVIHSKWKKDFN